MAAEALDLFPGLSVNGQIRMLAKLLDEEALPSLVAGMLRRTELKESLLFVGLPLAHSPDSVLGATLELRATMTSGQQGVYALTTGPPWIGYRAADRKIVSVLEDGSSDGVENSPASVNELLQWIEKWTDPSEVLDSDQGGKKGHGRHFDTASGADLTAVLAARGLDPPPSLLEAWTRSDVSDPVRDVLLRPTFKTAAACLRVLDVSEREPPPHLFPIAVVDSRSLAAVACQEMQGPAGAAAGLVFRWFLSDVPDKYQLALLDTDAVLYIDSLEEELAAREGGLERVLDSIGPAYKQQFREAGRRAPHWALRPVRLACQNTIVGLSAITHDSTFDGLAVAAWQTCEVAHVATHEGNRALAALMLCDAFQNGGTMEIRFDRPTTIELKEGTKTFEGHPEGQVPASLRRYGRTVDVPLGADNRGYISPSEARQLFWAVTPMPADLRRRAERATATYGLTPERLCFTLLSQTWREIELDFMLSTSNRVPEILQGGSPWRARLARQSEMELCRAALMIGMYFRRVNNSDTASDREGPRPVEDATKGVTWTVHEDIGAVTFSNLDEDALPWGPTGRAAPDVISVLPRPHATQDDLDVIRDAKVPGVRALMIPGDAPLNSTLDSDGLLILSCPRRVADLDRDAEHKLTASRLARA